MMNFRLILMIFHLMLTLRSYIQHIQTGVLMDGKINAVLSIDLIFYSRMTTAFPCSMTKSTKKPTFQPFLLLDQTIMQMGIKTE